MHLEELRGLGQVVATGASQCQQRRHHQQNGVVPTRDRDAYIHDGGNNTELGVAMTWQIEEQRYEDGGLLYGVFVARPYPS